MLKDFESINTTDSDVRELQYRLSTVLRPVTKNPVLDGILLEDIVLGTSSTDVPHKLGRAARGYIPVKMNASANVYDEESSNSNKENFLKLKASASVTVNLWVF